MLSIKNKIRINKFGLVTGKNGLFNWLFWSSLILFLLLYIAHIIILFLNPHQFTDFNIKNDVFLGFYNLNVQNNDLYLNWIPYFFGFLIILITGINCLAYWLLVNIDLSLYLRKKEIIILFITASVSLVLIFILNIFNKPVFDLNKLDLVANGWNIDLTKASWSMQFNYVYDISFIYSEQIGSTCFLSISKFSSIWIIMIIATFLIYLCSLFSCCYHSQNYLSLFYRKEY